MENEIVKIREENTFANLFLSNTKNVFYMLRVHSLLQTRGERAQPSAGTEQTSLLASFGGRTQRSSIGWRRTRGWLPLGFTRREGPMISDWTTADSRQA